VYFINTSKSENDRRDEMTQTFKDKFSEYERRASFERIGAELLEEAYEARGSEYYSDLSEEYHLVKDRVQAALLSIGCNDLADKITKCGRGKKCQSIWCESCRNRAAEAYKRKIKEQITEKYGSDYDEKLVSDNLLHITGHCEVCRFDIDSLRQAIERDKIRWRKMRERDASEGIWGIATYEFELINCEFMLRSNGDKKKQESLAQMIKQARTQGLLSKDDNQVLFVHWHGIFDAMKDQIEQMVGDLYHVEYDKVKNGEMVRVKERVKKTAESGLYVQKLREGNSLEENIKRVTSYNFKNAIRYKHTFAGSDYKSGEEIDRQDLGQLVKLYSEVQGSNWRSLYREIGI
jgi:hypothetical protein